MRAALASTWLLLAACDHVFLAERRPDAAAPRCPVTPVGDPALDDDRDGVANGADNCPLAANVDQHDEDGDGFGDACALCAVEPELRDADCDGIGDVCDPDDARPDVRQFYGFGSAAGLTLSPGATLVTVQDDALRMTKDTLENYGYANANVDVALEGEYETRFTLGARRNDAGYFDVQLRFGGSAADDPRDGYSVRVVGGSAARLDIGTVLDATPAIMSVDIDDPPAGRYVLRARVGASSVRVELLGIDGTPFMAALDLPMALAVTNTPSRFGLRTHYTDVAFDYLSRTGPP